MQILRAGFWQNGFLAEFIIGLPHFFANFVAGFFLLFFVGDSAQKNPPGKSPANSSRTYTTKIPDTFLQRGRANNSGFHGPFSDVNQRQCGRLPANNGPGNSTPKLLRRNPPVLALRPPLWNPFYIGLGYFSFRLLRSEG